MMITVLVSVLAIALVVTTGDAATVMNQQLPFSIFEESTECDGNPIGTGVITSLVAMEQDAFCEITVQNLGNGDKVTVYTKVVLTSCDAVPMMGVAFLDAFTCTDSACSDCTDVDNIPVQANLMVPKYAPLPAADTCWGVEAISTGITILNQFDSKANAENVDTYWKVYTENSCLKDTVQVSSASIASTALATTMGILLMASLLK
jgi:hypothetical protein